MQFYLDPSRESDPHALPDAEVYHISKAKAQDNCFLVNRTETDPGWYWWSCFPGCMPESTAFGPYTTEQEAIAGARNQVNA